MLDAIGPPRAARPDEACGLVCDALSDGDLEAALAQYEPGAVVSPAPGDTVRGLDRLRNVLAIAAASRQLFAVEVQQSLVADDLALVSGRFSGGLPPTGSGRYTSVVRRAADGHWRIAMESIVPDVPGGAA